jgi:hypothetical protein
MEFNESRFIKLPIEGYLDLLGIEPNTSQTGIINGLNNPKYRFVCAAVSRRQGKTYIANILGQLVSLVPNSHILLMSPNYSLSQISFDLQRQLIKHFDLEVIRDNAKDKVIELSNNSTIRMGSVNQVDSVVGRSYDLIIFDEAALVDGKDAFNVALRPYVQHLIKKTQKHFLYLLLVVEIIGLLSFGIEDLVVNIQSGHLFVQPITKTHDFLRVI